MSQLGEWKGCDHCQAPSLSTAGTYGTPFPRTPTHPPAEHPGQILATAQDRSTRCRIAAPGTGAATAAAATRGSGAEVRDPGATGQAVLPAPCPALPGAPSLPPQLPFCPVQVSHGGPAAIGTRTSLTRGVQPLTRSHPALHSCSCRPQPTAVGF